MDYKKTRKELQHLFRYGAKPSEEDFRAFIESVLNVRDDGIEKPTGMDRPLKIKAIGPEEHLLDFYADDRHSWRLNQYPAGAQHGLNFSANEKSRLFIESNTGHVGLGTVSPQATFHIMQSDNTDALRITNGEKQTSLFLVNSKGNVGIGTMNPGNDKLAVNGALRLKYGVPVNEFSNDGKFESNSETALPTEKAVKSYIDQNIKTLADFIEACKHPLKGSPLLDFQTNNLSITGNVDIGTEEQTGNTLSVHGKLKLAQGVIINEFSGDGTFKGDSDTAVPTEKAVKSYIDRNIETLGNFIEERKHPLSGSLLLDFRTRHLLVVGDVAIGTAEQMGSTLSVKGKLKLKHGVVIDTFSGDGTFKGDSDTAVPTEKAVKSYVDQCIKRLGNFIEDHKHPIQGSPSLDFQTKDLKVTGDVHIGIKDQQRRSLSVNGTLKLEYGMAINEFSCDVELQDASDTAVPTEKAVKSYIDHHITTLGDSVERTYLRKDAAALDLRTKHLTVDEYVGIGISEPKARLHIAEGDLRFDSGSVIVFTDDGQIVSRNKNHRILFRRPENIFEIREYGDIMFSPGTRRGKETAKVLLKAGGQVGIGTTSPIQQLDVNGRIHVSNGVIQAGGDAITDTKDLGLYSQIENRWMRLVTSNAPILFFTDGGKGRNACMVITSDGSVGIGTVEPSNARLHVGDGNDTLRIGAVNWMGKAKNRKDYGLERSRNQIVFSTYRDRRKNKLGAKIVAINKQTYRVTSRRQANQSTDLAFYTVPPNTEEYDATLERMRITDTGNVGIGTPDPGATLHVNGNLKVGNWEIIDTGCLEFKMNGTTHVKFGPKGDTIQNVIEDLVNRIEQLELELKRLKVKVS